MRTNLSVLLESFAFQLYRQERQGSGQGLACADKTGILPLQAPTYFHLPSLTHLLNARPPNLGPSPEDKIFPNELFLRGDDGNKYVESRSHSTRSASQVLNCKKPHRKGHHRHYKQLFSKLSSL